jgi:hypothetical protein
VKKYVVTTVVLTMILVPSAVAVNSSIGTRVSALERKVAALQRTVGAMNQQQTELAAFANCIRTAPTVPVNRYGQPSSGNGFMYADIPRDVIFVTTALDVADPGDTVGARLAAVNPQCVTAAAVSRQGESKRRIATFGDRRWKAALPNVAP